MRYKVGYLGRGLRFGDFVYTASEPLYHGTYHDFDRPKLNAQGAATAWAQSACRMRA